MTTEASKSDSLALTQLLVGGKDIPFLLLNVDMGADDDFEGHFTVASEHADLLRVSSTIEIRFNGKLMCRAGRLLSTRREGDTIVCRAASSVTADPPLWERHKDAHGQLQPLETLPFVEKTLA